MTTTVDRQEKIKAQRDMCERKNYPHFAPPTGYCYRCRRDIYEEMTVEQAGEKLVTGCKYCHMSYCD